MIQVNIEHAIIREVYQPYLSFLDIEMARVVEMRVRERQGHIYPLKLSPWLLMARRGSDIYSIVTVTL